MLSIVTLKNVVVTVLSILSNINISIYQYYPLTLYGNASLIAVVMSDVERQSSSLE